MYSAQFGMSNIPPIDHTNLKRLHGMAFSIARIDDDEYKCAKIPGQLSQRIQRGPGLGIVAGGRRRCEKNHDTMASGLPLLPAIAEG